MLSPNPLLLPLFGGVVNAANLWATHYSGTINYLAFTGNSSLTLASSSRTNNNLPSWITYDSAGKELYIPDEVFQGPSTGSLVSFSIGNNGALTAGGKGTTPQGVVANALYGGSNGKGFIANVHYQTSQLTTFKLPLTGGSPLQTIKYTMSAHGPNSRQDAPHPHHAFVDPTGDFVLVPDLGADLIRIHKIDQSSGKLTECGSGKAPGGTGPRHGAFWQPSSSKSRIARQASTGTMLFIANELGNSIGAWSVAYPSGGCLSLTLKQTLTPYQGNTTAKSGTKVGEVHTKGNFVYISNRRDGKYNGNDSITQYTIAADGSITWTDNTSAYGTYPRTFSINNAGDYVAIGDQTTSNVAIVSRNPTTGKLGPQVANLRIGSTGTPENEDGLSAVVWAE